MPIPPTGEASPSRDDEVESAGVHQLDHHRAGGDLGVGQLRQIGVDAVAQGQPDLFPGAGVAAVQQDVQHRG